MQSSSLFLRSCATFVSALSLFSSTASAATTTASTSYALQTNFAGTSFFNQFDFFTTADPTHGFVTYVNQSDAVNRGLISATDGSPVIIGVDHINTYNGNAAYYGINGVGRPSVRITSKQKFNHGLFIADIANMPGGVCGTWPAFWTLGDGTWPYHGEIDIIEQVNSATNDMSSMHTAGHCIAPNSSSGETGTIQTSNCTYDTATGTNAAGCGVLGSNSASFGLNFNANGGGVYAMEWTAAAIKIWFFPRSSIPADIEAGSSPSPSGWGTPAVNFQGDCNIDANFVNHQIVLDTTFCGDWAGSVWGDTCASSTGVSSCSVYVGNNPSAFKNMYWSINSIKVYQASSSSSTTATTSTTMTTSTTSTTKSTTPVTTSSSSITTTKSTTPVTTTPTTTKSTTAVMTTTKSTTKSTTTTTTTTRRHFVRDEQHETSAPAAPTPLHRHQHGHARAHHHRRRVGDA